MMALDEMNITRLIIDSYTEKLKGLLRVDVAMVGAGPANLTAGYYLGKAGFRCVLFLCDQDASQVREAM